MDRAGAEIFFWLSAYDGGRDLVAKAWQYHRFLASAVQTTYARILNPMGETLAITGIHDQIATCTVDLDVALFHTDFNKTQIPAIREKYGPEVTFVDPNLKEKYLVNPAEFFASIKSKLEETLAKLHQNLDAANKSKG